MIKDNEFVDNENNNTKLNSDNEGSKYHLIILIKNYFNRTKSRKQGSKRREQAKGRNSRWSKKWRKRRKQRRPKSESRKRKQGRKQW